MFPFDIDAAVVVIIFVGAMPKSCQACGLWLRRDGNCGKISCSKFVPRLTDGRGSWLKALRKQTPQKATLQKTPQAKILPPSLTKPRLRIFKKSAAPPPPGHSSVDKGSELPSAGLRTPPRKNSSSADEDMKHNIRSFVQPLVEEEHGVGLDASKTDKDTDLMQDFVSNELLAGPLAPVVRQKRFFDIVAKPHAHTDSNDNVLLLTSALSMHFEKFHMLVGEVLSLRILAQISTILSYIPATASVDSVAAYAAACFIVSFELVGSWEDPLHDRMKTFVSSNITKDVKSINHCIMQLLNWMGQQ